MKGLISLINAFHLIRHLTGMTITFIPLQVAPSGAYGMTFPFMKQFSLCFCMHDCFWRTNHAFLNVIFALRVNFILFIFLHANTRILTCHQSHGTDTYKKLSPAKECSAYKPETLHCDVISENVSTNKICQPNCINNYFYPIHIVLVVLCISDPQQQQLSSLGPCSKMCFRLLSFWVVSSLLSAHDVRLISYSLAFSLFSQFAYNGGGG